MARRATAPAPLLLAAVVMAVCALARGALARGALAHSAVHAELEIANNAELASLTLTGAATLFAGGLRVKRETAPHVVVVGSAQTDARAVELARNRSATFEAALPGGGHVVATRLGDAGVHAVVRLASGEMLHVQPTSHARLPAATRRRLAGAEHVASWHNGTACAARDFSAAETAALDAALAAGPPLSGRGTTGAGLRLGARSAPMDSGPASQRRRLVANELYAARAQRWTGCFAGQETGRVAEIGIVADRGFVRAFGSPAGALEVVQALVAAANMVLHFQLNVQVRVRQLLLVDGAVGGDEPWTRFLEADPEASLGARCPFETECLCDVAQPGDTSCAPEEQICGIAQSLNAMTWLSGDLFKRRPKPFASWPPAVSVVEQGAGGQTVVNELTHLAHWHLLTDCFDGAGQIGIAWGLDPSESNPRLGTNCMSGLNTGVTTRSSDTWVTLVHELGHALGMKHAFEEGQGRTGGLMDYGDGKYEGVFQFHGVYDRPQACAELAQLVADGACAVPDEADLFPPMDLEACSALPGGDPRDLYCASGFCPVYADGSVGRCRPLPPALVLGEREIDFVAAAGVGLPVSTMGSPRQLNWRFLDSTLCSADANSTERAEVDVGPLLDDEDDDQTLVLVLAKRGGCQFDEKARNAADLGAAALVLFDPAADPAFNLVGDERALPIHVGSISRQDALRIVQELEAAPEGTLPGYFGAAPPHLLQHRDATLDPISEPSGISPALLAGLVAYGSAIGVILLCGSGYAMWRGQRLKVAARMRVAAASSGRLEDKL